jgi:ABC-type transporter Mla subunit MlaD
MTIFRRNDPIAALSSKLDDQTKLLLSLMTRTERIMSTLADLVTAEAAEDADVKTLLGQVDTLLAQVAAGAPDQATINSLVAQVNATKAKIEAKIAAAQPAA